MHPTLIRRIAKLLNPRNESQFILNGDPDSDNWNDYLMKKKKLEYLMLSYFLAARV